MRGLGLGLWSFRVLEFGGFRGFRVVGLARYAERTLCLRIQWLPRGSKTKTRVIKPYTLPARIERYPQSLCFQEPYLFKQAFDVSGAQRALQPSMGLDASQEFALFDKP